MMNKFIVFRIQKLFKVNKYFVRDDTPDQAAYDLYSFLRLSFYCNALILSGRTISFLLKIPDKLRG